MESDVPSRPTGRPTARGRRRRGRGAQTARRARPARRRHDRPRPDRQPRRDRAAHPACLPDPRRRGGRRVLRGRPAVAAGDARRRGHLHRPGRRQALLPLGARAHLRRARHRLRRGPPGLRLPVRGRRVRRRRPRPRPHVHRPARQRPGAVRLEGGDPPPARRARPADDPGLGPAGRRGPRPRGGRADRLPGARQAVGGRRRQGDAHGPLAARAGRGPADLPLRGARRVRRRLAVPRALARGQPARRGAGRGRPVRPRRPPVGARLLRPAPAPEDPRGVAVAGDDRRPGGASSPSARSGPSSRPATRTSARSSSSSTTTATPTSSRSTAGSRSSTR